LRGIGRVIMKKKISVEGMSCMNCVKHVKHALEEIEGVNDVEVDLAGKYALIQVKNVKDDTIKSAIEDAGYDVINIKEI
jgi:copper chaperone